MIAGGVPAFLAVVAVITGSALLEAAPPSARAAGPRRFFEGLLGRGAEAEPAFIPAPTPPGPEEIESLARQAAAKSPPRLAARPEVKPTTSPALLAPAREVAARPPTWGETIAFASSLQATARKVAVDAANPQFKPTRVGRPDPAPASAGSASAPASASDRPAPDAGRAATAKAKLPKPTGAAAPATARFNRLRVRITQTLAAYQRRPLNTAQHTPWEVMHGFIAFGIPTKVRVGGPAGDLVNAIGWVITCPPQRPPVLTQPIAIQSKKFTVADLVKEEQLACRSNTELTFALIALAHYLPTDARWEARDGKTWSLEKLVTEEIEQPIRGAPCGGTHRLFGLAYGCQRRLRATGGLDGVYLRADKFVRDYQQFALTKLQNRDGSFSTEWFKYPADRDDDIDRKIQTTGHILEWLVASLDQDDLFQPRVTAAVEFLTAALAREPSRDWKIGPLGHALHALTIYQERAWGTVLPGGIAAFHGGMKPPPVAFVAGRLDADPDDGEPAPAAAVRR